MMPDTDFDSGVMVETSSPSKLAVEVAVYRARSAEFERDHPGEVVAIKGDRIIGFWPDRPSALAGAFEAVGLTDVLVRAVGAPDPVATFSRGPARAFRLDF